MTQAVMEQIHQRIEDAKEQLCSFNDRDYDQFTKGMIRAFSEVLEIKLDYPQEESEDEVSE